MNGAWLSWSGFEQTMSVLTALRGPDLVRVKGLVAIEECRGPIAPEPGHTQFRDARPAGLLSEILTLAGYANHLKMLLINIGGTQHARERVGNSYTRAATPTI
jgi:hypothetical protein